MAVPLFVADEATLKERLRLSAVPASALDTEAIIDEAILRARIRFYKALGTARVNELLAIAFTELPTTDDEVLRAQAFSTEIKMVQADLLRSLPNAFMDASGEVNHMWNETPILRERGFSDLSEELRRLEDEITSGLVDLAAPNDMECNEVQTFDGTPDPYTGWNGSAPRVGRSLKYPYGTNQPAED